MINQSKLHENIEKYKEAFPTRWGDEKFKWEAVKCFQDNWNANAADFAVMLHRSLDKTFNLLASNNNFPRAMIEDFAKYAPEEVRTLFIALFDESQDVTERILKFKNVSAMLLQKYGDGAAQHFQYENAITTYLWLRYPDKYYIYKYSEAKTVADELNSGYKFKKGAYADNLRNFFNLYNELREQLKKDTQLINLLKSSLTDNCYDDPGLCTLTIDVGFYISRASSDSQQNSNEWTPVNYNPGISVEKWVELLNDKKVFTDSSLQIVQRLKDYGGAATCTQLAVKYGETKNFYRSGIYALSKRVADKTGCPIYVGNDGESLCWPVLFTGKVASTNEEGSFIWKIRDELSDALDQIDLSSVELFSLSEVGEESTMGYWWLNANPKLWSYSDIDVGSVQTYTLYNDNGNKRRIFQNFLNAKAGDMVIGYESYPVKKIVAICKISFEQNGEEIGFEKVEGLANPINYQTIKGCPELEKMEYFTNPQGSLFRLSKGEYEFIMDMIREENPVPQDEKQYESYSKTDYLNDVYMSENRYDTLVAVLKNKKNIILQGAPGVGKTFAAKRLAYSIIGEKDDSRIEFVQFHQNYSYEDFVMGYKPEGNGFELKDGIFTRFCRTAQNQPDKDYFFIIDEINRGNMSKIFGELLMLIEKDYRGTKTTMAYNQLTFTVPKNLYIIGMMNTADRSLAMIDYALRRRFSFFEVAPGFDSEGFAKYQESLDNELFDKLIDEIKILNKEIEQDRSLGKGFCIGHSYFCNQTQETCTDDWLHAVVEYDILPMLSEYWFDEQSKLQRWENNLRGVLQ